MNMQKEERSVDAALKSITKFYQNNAEKITTWDSLYNSWARKNEAFTFEEKEKNVIFSYCRQLMKTDKDMIEQMLAVTDK